LTGGYDGTVRFWNAESGEARCALGRFGGVESLALSTPTKTLATTGFSWRITLVDVDLDEPSEMDLERITALLVKLDDDSYETREAASQELSAIGMRAERELARAAKESESTEVRIRARRIREEILTRTRSTIDGHDGRIDDLAVSPDGRVLASASRDGTVRLRRLPAGEELARLALKE
jgi:WD40 repeat protein